MASKSFIQHTVDGRKTLTMRSKKQGRKPIGLAKPRLYRLYQVDDDRLAEMGQRLGSLFNANEFVRNAVHNQCNSVYTELLKL